MKPPINGGEFATVSTMDVDFRDLEDVLVNVYFGEGGGLKSASERLPAPNLRRALSPPITWQQHWLALGLPFVKS